MRKILLFSLLFIILSCQEKKDNTDNGEDLDGTYIQEIGKLYYPEKLDTRPKKIGPRNEKKDYIITITNSDSLENDSINIKLDSKNIAYLYKKHLIKNHRNPKNIIVNIKRRNGNNQSFEFEEKNLIKLEVKKEKSK
ncbi:hypothetical protein D3C85_1276800 [compost metagenome]